jgi:hypothetical protein
VHKRKHKKNATFVLLMFMLNAHQRFRLLVLVLMLISSCEPGLSLLHYYYLNLFKHGGLSGIACFSKGRAYKNITCLATNTIIITIYKIWILIIEIIYN